MAMLTGLVIAWGIAVPVLTSMGDLPTGKTLAQYATGIWSSQVRFIGAGVIGVGAIWTLATLFMPMARGVKASFSALSKAGKARAGQAPRTERDLSAGWISLVTLVLVAILVVTFQVFLADAPLSAMAVWKLVAYAVLFAFVFGFLVAAACGYMAGLVGIVVQPDLGRGHRRHRVGLAADAGPGRRAAGSEERRADDHRAGDLQHLGGGGGGLDRQRQPAGPEDRLAGGRDALAPAGGAADRLRARRRRDLAGAGTAV